MNDNVLELEAYGKLALFTDPVLKTSGNKVSYNIPTYEAIKGLLRSVYWKPPFDWVIKKVRVMNEITFQQMGHTPRKDDGSSSCNSEDGRYKLLEYVYLKDVRYQIVSELKWNNIRRDTEGKDFSGDHNLKKHMACAKRFLERGGKLSPFLGVSECHAFVRPVKFGSMEGFYDKSGEKNFGRMYHGMNYPDETGEKIIQTRFWEAKMIDGIIEFISPEECPYLGKAEKMEIRRFRSKTELKKKGQ